MYQIKAFSMKLYPGKVEEYKKRHDAIWPELVEVLENHGISDYSIHLDEETNVLFAIHKIRYAEKLEELSHHLLMKKWWQHMADIMETNDDHSPKTTVLKTLFVLNPQKQEK